MASKGELTRERILLKSMDLFHKKGAHQVSLSKIAAALRMHQTAIYVYFRNKDDLLAACCEYSVAASRAEIEAGTKTGWSARERLQWYFAGQFSFVAEFPERASALLAMYYLGPSSKLLRKTHETVDERSMAHIEESLRQGAREKLWRVENPAAAARSIHSALVGEMIKRFCYPGENPIRKSDASRFWATVSLFFDER